VAEGGRWQAGSDSTLCINGDGIDEEGAVVRMQAMDTLAGTYERRLLVSMFGGNR